MADVDPILMTFDVPLTSAEAFELFTTELDTWWPLQGHSCTDDEQAEIRFDRRTGGDVTESSADGSKHFVWGTLSVWNPPACFAMSWHPGQSSDKATRLTVSFVDTDSGCYVTLKHDGWAARGEDALQARDMYSKGWVGVTQAYVKCAEARLPATRIA